MTILRNRVLSSKTFEARERRSDREATLASQSQNEHASMIPGLLGSVIAKEILQFTSPISTAGQQLTASAEILIRDRNPDRTIMNFYAMSMCTGRCLPFIILGKLPTWFYQIGISNTVLPSCFFGRSFRKLFRDCSAERGFANFPLARRRSRTSPSKFHSRVLSTVRSIVCAIEFIARHSARRGHFNFILIVFQIVLNSCLAFN